MTTVPELVVVLVVLQYYSTTTVPARTRQELKKNFVLDHESVDESQHFIDSVYNHVADIPLGDNRCLVSRDLFRAMVSAA